MRDYGGITMINECVMLVHCIGFVDLSIRRTPQKFPSPRSLPMKQLSHNEPGIPQAITLRFSSDGFIMRSVVTAAPQ
jgi:hypothetical protein